MSGTTEAGRDRDRLDPERLALAMYRAGVPIPRYIAKAAWRRKLEAVAREYAALSSEEPVR